MPHVDEFLGVATIAAAGLAVAVAIQPIGNGSTNASPASGATIDGRSATPVTHVQTIEVVARRAPSTPATPRPTTGVS